MPRHSGTGYRSGRGLGVGAFSPPRTQQGVPMQPVPMSGQTGASQGPIWSIADAIMASTFGDDVALEDDDIEDDDVADEPRIADWDVWNTPRYDVDRFYQTGDGACEGRNRHVGGAGARRVGYLGCMSDDEGRLRRYISACLVEMNTMASGNVRGVVTPLGTGPKHPKGSDRRGSKKRNRRRLELSADAFGSGEYVNKAGGAS